MPLLDDTKALGGPEIDTADVSRIVDNTVSDPISMIEELMTSSPGGMWANRVCAVLAYLVHKANGDDGVSVGTDDAFATQDNGSRLRVSGTSVLVRNAADSSYLVLRPSSIVLGTFGQYIIPVNGTPEGAVSAVQGSLALRTDGGAGTGLYVKESGSGNTGWVAK